VGRGGWVDQDEEENEQKARYEEEDHDNHDCTVTISTENIMLSLRSPTSQPANSKSLRGVR
jgi:hypothetical protein